MFPSSYKIICISDIGFVICDTIIGRSVIQGETLLNEHDKAMPDVFWRKLAVANQVTYECTTVGEECSEYALSLLVSSSL